MIRTITSYAVRRRWLVIVVWAVVGIGLSVAGQSMMYRVTGSSAGEFLPGTYDSAAALRIAGDEFGEKPDANAVTMVVHRTDERRLTAGDLARIERTAGRLAAHRIVQGEREPLMKDYSQTPAVTPGPVAPDGAFRLLTVSLRGNALDPGLHEVWTSFRDTARAEFAGTGLAAGFTGGLATTVDEQKAGERTGMVVQILTLGLIVLLNVLAFRSVLAAVVPLFAVTVIGGAGLGAVAGAAQLLGFRLDPSTPSLIGVVLLGIGIDYFLFLLFRFRELLRTRPELTRHEAAAEAAGRVGTAVACAALTIVAAFATLGLASFGQFRVLGPSIAVSVLVMLLASLTLMPALLAVFGRAMFWPSRAWRRERTGGPSARLGEAVSRRPGRFVLVCVALLGVLAAGAAGVRMSYDEPAGKRTEAVETAERIARSLPAGASDPHTVYVRGRALPEGEVTALADALAKVPGVGEVGAPVLNERGSAARFDVYLTPGSDTRQARDLVSGPVRAAIAAHTPGGAEAHITGTAAVFADVSTAVGKDLRLVFPVAALLIAVILLLLLRSLLAPIVLLAVIGLGFAATLGASTLVFQHGLDHPGVSFVLPLVLFLFVVALGTDYNILISDRIREEMADGTAPRRAVAAAVRHTAPAIATAGLVLAGSFAGLTADPATREVGFSTGVGILLSALVLSVVLVPALAVLLGRALWWPRRGSGKTRPAVSLPPAPAPSRTPAPLPAPGPAAPASSGSGPRAS
ncbi:MMPL family transporter [Streptomyces sp. NPDC051940]|uniref:MMPL family transporter n=1 Tax=Streptomyces sp. NPDC051940 TaxID=3155675 RepID=UPI003422F675